MSKQHIFAAAGLMLSAASANAAWLVDTGAPTVINGGPIISPYSWLAGKFSLDSVATITSIETFHGFNVARPVGSGLAFSIRADDEPDDSPGSLIFSIADAGPSGLGFSGWFGVNSLSWQLPAGTYWVTLEVLEGQNFQGFLAFGVPDPLPLSFYSWGLQDWIPADQVIGSTRNAWRIGGSLAAAIPEPATWGLMIAGFGLVGVSLRRGDRIAAA
jgi:hypothetical protein